MKKLKDAAAKKAGSGANGNITVDLGEAIDRKLRSVMGKTAEPAEKKVSMGSSRYSPGMYGWRPSYADRPSRFGGSMGRWNLGGSAPFGISRQISTMSALTGVAVGLVGNRALMRISPAVVKTDNLVVHSAIAFVVGIIPVLIRQNSVTLGVAVPGAVYLGGSIVDWAFDAVGISKPALRGSGQGSGVGNAIQARERLQSLAQRMVPQRVQARQFAG